MSGHQTPHPHDTAPGVELEVVARHNYRAPRAKTRVLWDALLRILDPYDLIGVRGAYYQAEMAGVVGKTEADYDRVQRALLAMRRAGVLPYSKICDNARERRSIYQYGELGDALESWHRTYRRNYWIAQPATVEIWCEKDALTPVINPVCQRYGVTFCAIRGFESESFTYASAQDLLKIGKPAHIYYFGDHDPSGWFIANGLESGLRSFGVNAAVIQVAVTPRQVAAWRLPTRPAKRSDSRLPAFLRAFGSDRCTEVDAIPPTTLQALVKNAIVGEIDKATWTRTQRVEELERESLANVIDLFGKATPGTRYEVTA